MSERPRRDTHRPTIRSRSPFAVRPALLLARRLAFARPGRAVLVAALIGLPIAGLAAGGVLIASSTQSTEDRLTVELGQSAAMLEANGPDIAGMRQDPVDRYTSTIAKKSPLQRYYDRPDTSDADASAFPTPDLLGSVPDGAASIPVRQGTAVVSGPRVPVTVNAVEGQTWAGALQGHWERIDGGVPRSGNEVLVTPATLDRLHIAIGQTLELNDPVQRQVTVVGTLRDLGVPSSTLAVFGEWGSLGLEDDGTAQVFLPDRSVTWPEIQRYNDHGIVVESRAVVLHPPFPSTSTRGAGSLISYGYVGLAGVFALFEVGLLAAAAFLVSSRADTRTHAVLASVGGDRRFLFTVVSSSGLVLGAVGGRRRQRARHRRRCRRVPPARLRRPRAVPGRPPAVAGAARRPGPRGPGRLGRVARRRPERQPGRRGQRPPWRDPPRPGVASTTGRGGRTGARRRRHRDDPGLRHRGPRPERPPGPGGPPGPRRRRRGRARAVPCAARHRHGRPSTARRGRPRRRTVRPARPDRRAGRRPQPGPDRPGARERDERRVRRDRRPDLHRVAVDPEQRAVRVPDRDGRRDDRGHRRRRGAGRRPHRAGGPRRATGRPGSPRPRARRGRREPLGRRPGDVAGRRAPPRLHECRQRTLRRVVGGPGQHQPARPDGQRR
ncbi:hypothetical protein [Curtobacterium sp. MCPF17_052]|uniref:hypothetical protein n=1 Tax=Curtobacterium sp. MCPF17_052 TaxID=2175655 RepID=UPI0024DF59C3|nr:hypothetical protein [Curtobacterium sp. MCPF17_052]WIB11279.1 hypothetical protein DEJ36_09330 [Curtobacterium sp. MCPF17_052]